jgi:hypothetical protein
MNELPDAPAFTGVIQMAYVVPDVKQAALDHVRLAGIGPWFLREHFAGTDLVYRGAPTDIDMAIAFACCGTMLYELIQPLNDVPSVYQEVIDRRGFGFHHYGIATTSFERDIERYRTLGYEPAFLAKIRGTRIGYLDTTANLPGMIELIEMTEANRALMTMVYRASVGWDGSDPLRARA